MIKLLDLLKEAFDNNNTIAYHRSRADFDKFDISKTESGFGGTLQGWGLYFSENPDVDTKYGPILYKVKFNVPAGKKWLDDYLTYDDALKLINNLGVNGEEEINNIDWTAKQKGKVSSMPFILYVVPKYFNGSTAGWFGKDFAEFLMKNNYIGRKVPYCDHDYTCWIVFDPSIIEIISKG